jgi:hypothetical protein
MNPMTEVIRYRKLKAQAEASDVTQRLVNGAVSSLAMGGKPRVMRHVAQAVLLGSPWMWHGNSLDVKAKSLGAGVYELRVDTK